MIQWMIHLNHPCREREMDVWVIEREEDYAVALGQGYLPLSFIREMCSTDEALDRQIEMIEEVTPK